MRIEFKDYADISEVLKYNIGFKPIYGKGTMKGVVWCALAIVVLEIFCILKKEIKWSAFLTPSVQFAVNK